AQQLRCLAVRQRPRGRVPADVRQGLARPRLPDPGSGPGQRRAMPVDGRRGQAGRALPAPGPGDRQGQSGGLGGDGQVRLRHRRLHAGARLLRAPARGRRGDARSLATGVTNRAETGRHGCVRALCSENEERISSVADSPGGCGSAMNANDIETGGKQGAGEQLRRARRAAGLSQADVAARLKMPLRVVQSLETEDWSRLGAPVFVRGQLRSYSKLLGLTIEPVVEAAGVEPVRPPTLTPRTYVAPWQRFAEQAARRFVYIVMTVAIAIPVWLATRPHLDIVAHEGAPLDAPATDATRSPAPAEPATDPHPLVASLAPIPARAPALSLRFSGDSWIEVMDADGK